MKIAIGATGTTLTSPIDPRFGRCANFIIFDLDNDIFTVQPNASCNSGGGAGVQAAQFIVQQGAQAVVAGRVGPNAVQVLNAASVKIYVAHEMTAQQAIDAFKARTLTAA
jgi:predicted Fe-Mo cluster-binding NifX family protein